MQLQISGSMQEFVHIKDFRERHQLPQTFGLAALEPKKDRQFGSIENAGEALNGVRKRIVAVVPKTVDADQWLTHIERLSTSFEAELYNINEQVKLRDEEIAYAVDGFRDVCGAVAFALARANLTHSKCPPFEQIYHTWLQDTVRLGGSIYEYEHTGETWLLRVVIHAYGRFGLQVTMPNSVDYVLDPALACPAEGFMVTLLREVAAQMI